MEEIDIKIPLTKEEHFRHVAEFAKKVRKEVLEEVIECIERLKGA